MKIFFFIPSLRGGGAERIFVRMATYYARRGHEVDMVLLNGNDRQYCNELADDVRVIDLKVPRLWTGLPAFRRLLLDEKPDVVISAMPLANGIAAWTKRLTNMPFVLVLTEHNAISMAFGDLDVQRYWPLMWLIRASYRFANALVGVSSGVSLRLLTLPGVKRNKVHAIYNPVWDPGIERCAQDIVPHPWFMKNPAPVIVAAGRLEAQKDFQVLLRAFAKVRQNKVCKLVLLGEGSLRGELASIVSELCLERDVSFEGFVTNPFAYMSKASVFVLSSLHEGLPTVLIEAMACGTPVVSTDCPSGPYEILDGGRYGPLVPVGDVDALAAAIEQQLDNPTSSELLQARAREFSVEASAEAYLKLINELIAGSE